MNSSLFAIMCVLSLFTGIGYLYKDSSWYFEPLLNGRILLVYLWYELPLLCTIFIWAGYDIIIKPMYKNGAIEYFKKCLAGMGAKLSVGGSGFLIAAAIMIIYVGVMFLINLLPGWQGILAVSEDSFRAKLITLGNSTLFYVLFINSDILLYPMAEELFFRGCCYNTLKRVFSINKSIGLSAVMFALYHQDLAGIIPYFLLGVIFAKVYERSKSLISPFVSHALYNTFFSYVITTANW